jgi:hypothetical protein
MAGARTGVVSDDDVEDDLPRAIDELGDNNHMVLTRAAGVWECQGFTDGWGYIRKRATDRCAIRLGTCAPTRHAAKDHQCAARQPLVLRGIRL